VVADRGGLDRAGREWLAAKALRSATVKRSGRSSRTWNEWREKTEIWPLETRRAWLQSSIELPGGLNINRSWLWGVIPDASLAKLSR
jgi:hypothetical protein